MMPMFDEVADRSVAALFIFANYAIEWRLCQRVIDQNDRNALCAQCENLARWDLRSGQQHTICASLFDQAQAGQIG